MAWLIVVMENPSQHGAKGVRFHNNNVNSTNTAAAAVRDQHHQHYPSDQSKLQQINYYHTNIKALMAAMADKRIAWDRGYKRSSHCLKVYFNSVMML